MTNHLIVGLGGTGGKMIRSLRKTIFLENRSTEAKNVNVGYIYMDTSEEMMGLDNPSWMVMGSSTQLDEGSKVHIAPIGLQAVLKDISKYAGISDWIGDTDVWNEFLGGAAGLQIAGGQRRRLGRFILACNIEKFNNALITQVRALQSKSGNTDVHFHICCGLAGGTGSGTLIDVLAQIRKKYIPSGNITYRIVLYLFLPERIPLPNWDANYYHANGYAALMELNAYEVGAYEPFDISIRGVVQNRRIGLSGVDKFAGCYLFSNTNENGNQLDTKTEVPEMIADFIYQKNIAAKDDLWEQEINFLENNENTVPPLEKSSKSKTPERSLRFLTFGVKRIAIPEQEIREYMMYNYAHQAAMQLRYNNWADETGFRNEARNHNLAEYVTDKNTHEKWKITDEHLQLSRPVIDDSVTKRWKPVGDTWRVLIPDFKETAKTNKDGNWIVELKVLCEKYYTENYRNMGVKNFFAAKKKEKLDIANAITRNIEHDLFEEWRNGVKSMHDIKRLLEELIDHLRKRYNGIAEKLTKNKDAQEKQLDKIKVNEKKWADMSILKKLIGNRSNLLNDQAIHLEDLYIIKTQEEGLEFEELLIAELAEQLEQLKAHVDIANTRFNESAIEFERNIEQRCNDDEKKMNEDEYYKQQVIRFYVPEKVRAITKKFIKDKKEQDSQTSVVRKALIELLGADTGFARFNERISKSTLVSTLESVCDSNVKNAEASLENNNRLFNMTIIDKLKDRYEGNFDELCRYLKKMIDFSGFFLDFDQNEINISGDGAKEPPTRIRTLAILIPGYAKHKNDSSSFVNTLVAAFKARVPDGVTPKFFDNQKNNEVVIINLVNGFPVRYCGLTGFLKEKYKERIEKTDGDRARIFLHTEGDGEGWPHLFIATEIDVRKALEKIRQQAFEPLLLAYSAGLLQQRKNSDGYMKYALVEKDDFGDIVPIFFLHEKFTESHNHITVEQYQKLTDCTTGLLKNNYRHRDKRIELEQQIREKVKLVKSERNDDDSDDCYIKYKAAAQKIIQQLKTE